MKKIWTMALVCMFCLVSMSALAKKPVPRGLVDEDGDGYFSDDKNEKLKDCDDSNPSIHPGAREIPDNGVDDSCRGSDLESPPAPVMKAFRVKAGDARAIIKLNQRIANCETDDDDLKGTCHVDVKLGKFHVDAGFRFIDLKCSGVEVLVTDDSDEAQRFDEMKARGVTCVKHHAKKKAKKPTDKSGSEKEKGKKEGDKVEKKDGADGSASSEPERLTVELSEQASKTVGEAKATAEDAKAKVTEFGKKVEEHSDLLKAHQGSLDTLGTALEAETKARKAEVKMLQVDIDRTSRVASATDREVKSLMSLKSRPSVLAEIYLGGTVTGQKPITAVKDGQTVGYARGSSSPGGVFGVNLGAENQKGRFNAFAGLALTSDRADNKQESSLAWTAGAETALALGGGSFLGPHVMYQQHQSGGTVLGGNAISRGAGLGMTYVKTSKGPFHYGLLARLTAGVESWGTSLPGYGNADNKSPFLGLQVTFLFGAGSSDQATEEDEDEDEDVREESP